MEVKKNMEAEITIPFQEEYEKLKLLISQGVFELVLPETDKGDIRLVYLMNDAVESFLIFRQAKLTGTYEPDFEGELKADLEKRGNQYILIVHQGNSVFTVFFRDLDLETHLFNYGKTGHFWVKEYEYLRQLEYRIAILRDKREYLGKEFCTEEEEKLSYLAEFPPLNFCCYPAVSEKYIVPSYPKWKVSEKALNEMMKLAQEAGDHSLIRWLKVYSYVSGRVIARKIACMLHRTKHTELVDLIDRKLAQAAAVYQDRQFVTEKKEQHSFSTDGKEGGLQEEETAEQTKIRNIQERAEARKRELECSGKKVEMLKEEPFLYAKDSVEYKVHLMIWKTEGRNRKVDVETIN